MPTLKGRRRPDLSLHEIHTDVQAGDYWKVLNDDGSPMISEDTSNLTHTVWMVACPMPSGSFGLGTLLRHTVREHEDGTISVRPGDGSSNSILMTGAKGQQYHGYIDHGVWSESM